MLVHFSDPVSGYYMPYLSLGVAWWRHQVTPT